jgi:hypothetical protein
MKFTTNPFVRFVRDLDWLERIAWIFTFYTICVTTMLIWNGRSFITIGIMLMLTIAMIAVCIYSILRVRNDRESRSIHVGKDPKTGESYIYDKTTKTITPLGDSD